MLRFARNDELKRTEFVHVSPPCDRRAVDRPRLVRASPARQTHRLAIHVDQNDPQVMNLALNNATNVIEYYRAKNEDVDVDIVTYGPACTCCAPILRR